MCIAVEPSVHEPYFSLEPDRRARYSRARPRHLDFKLTRGLWITGRVTDKATGKPVVPCSALLSVSVQSVCGNLPEFNLREASIRDEKRDQTEADGTFRLVGLPGRGLVAATSSGARLPHWPRRV